MSENLAEIKFMTNKTNTRVHNEGCLQWNIYEPPGEHRVVQQNNNESLPWMKNRSKIAAFIIA